MSNYRTALSLLVFLLLMCPALAAASAVDIDRELTIDADCDSVIEADRERIQHHLKEVEQTLRARDVSHLSDKLQKERKRNLDVLREYRRAGEFPHNTYVGWRNPVFIDGDDRLCAVGHLMFESGWESEARQIAARENLAHLPDMQSPEVAQWVEQSGLTAEEAAWIQPGYSSCYDECSCEPDPVCGDDGTTYVNPCFAEACAMVERWHYGCCEPRDEIDWSGNEPMFPQTACNDDPNDRTDQLCATGTDTSELQDDQWDSEQRSCSTTSLHPASGIAWLMVVALLLAVRRSGRRPQRSCG